jgi:hypothetical protein
MHPHSISHTLLPGMVEDETVRRGLATDGTGESSALLYTLYINLLIFGFIVCVFEYFRHFKQIYMKRSKKKFEVSSLTSYSCGRLIEIGNGKSSASSTRILLWMASSCLYDSSGRPVAYGGVGWIYAPQIYHFVFQV